MAGNASFKESFNVAIGSLRGSKLRSFLTLLGVIIGVGGLSAIFTGGLSLLASAAALVELLHYVLDFMLNGKLICLHREPGNPCACDPGGLTWAFGQVADCVDVGQDKNPVEDVDNDYAVNIILAPFDMMQFVINDDAGKNLATATQSALPQGDLLRMQSGVNFLTSVVSRVHKDGAPRRSATMTFAASSRTCRPQPEPESNVGFRSLWGNVSALVC